MKEGQTLLDFVTRESLEDLRMVIMISSPGSGKDPIIISPETFYRSNGYIELRQTDYDINYMIFEKDRVYFFASILKKPSAKLDHYQLHLLGCLSEDIIKQYFDKGIFNYFNNLSAETPSFQIAVEEPAPNGNIQF